MVATISNYWILTAYDGSCWIQSYSMPNPGNSAVSFPKKSTTIVSTLWNGDRAFVTPTVKSKLGAVSWEITEASATLAVYNQLTDYMDNHRKITITDHIGQTVTGYFTDVDKVMTLTGIDQLLIIKCGFIPL